MTGIAMGYRPAGVDGVTWSGVRRRWIQALEYPGQTVELRTALAAEAGMGFEQLRRWAKRCGWPSAQSHNGRAR